MRPNRNYLLLIPEKTNVEKTTASGIVYETAKSGPNIQEATLKGTVQKLGEGVNLLMKNGNRISVGDVVHYFPDNTSEIVYEGNTIVLVHRKYVSHIE